MTETAELIKQARALAEQIDQAIQNKAKTELTRLAPDTANLLRQLATRLDQTQRRLRLMI